MHPSPGGDTVLVTGTFVKSTDFPCHRSDPFVGGERVTFHGSDGSETTIVTRSANWIGRPADPPEAPLGQCRQVAAFEVRLPVAERYTVEINGRELRQVTLAELRAEGLRHVFRLPS
jgi:hypothetical protein